MRKFVSVFIVLLMTNFITPIIFYTFGGITIDSSYSNEEVLDEFMEIEQEELKELNDISLVAPENYFEDKVTLYNLENNEITTIDLLDYLIGTAACEMPSYYETEAIKAQMIASYSYYLYVLDNPTYLQTSYVPFNENLMQGYASKEKLMEYWQLDFDTHYSKYLRAANEVLGDVLIYEDKAILASYYAVSSGTTQSSEDEWGQKLDYLVNVDSSFDAVSEDYMQMVSYSSQEIYDRLNGSFAGFKDLNVSEAQDWFSEIEYTAGGYVKNIKIADSYVTGTDFRNSMALASSSFMVFYEDGVFSIATKGYGHGVGMSQFGANELSKDGKTYKEILSHYYPNTEILEKT